MQVEDCQVTDMHRVEQSPHACPGQDQANSSSLCGVLQMDVEVETKEPQTMLELKRLMYNECRHHYHQVCASNAV